MKTKLDDRAASSFIISLGLTQKTPRMAFIFTHIYADIAPELKENYLKCFPSTNRCTPANFSSLLNTICTLTGASFVDGNNPKLHGPWHSIRDAYDLLTGFLLQQNMNNLITANSNSTINDSIGFDRSVSKCTFEKSLVNVKESNHQKTNIDNQTPQQVHAHQQNTTVLPTNVQTGGFDSFVSTQNIFPQTDTCTNERMKESVTTSRSESVTPLAHDEQTSPHSSTVRNSVVIDFQDVNLETLRFAQDQQRETLNDMHVSNAPPTCSSIQIKKEYADDLYLSSHDQPKTNPNNGVDYKFQEQPSMFMMQNDGSMHVQIKETDSGTENVLEDSTQMPYTCATASSSVTEMTNRKDLPKLGKLGRGRPSKLQKCVSDTSEMFVKRTSDEGELFFCINCKYSTHSFKNIEDHVRRKHTERLFHCSMCSTKFGLKRDLKRHYKVKHFVVL